VLSQVYGGGGGASGTYRKDYVEIFNPTQGTLSLDGLTLQYGSATGQFGSSSSNIYTLPNVSLVAGGYYLVALGSFGTGGTELVPSADISVTNLSMSGANGKVALVNATTPLGCGATATPCALPNALIIDLVSYGVSNSAEGSAPTNGGVALTSTQGNVRKSNGCQDTDNNNSDFSIVSAPVPRNSASPLNVCPP
jgi:uncharacterized protein